MRTLTLLATPLLAGAVLQAAEIHRGLVSYYPLDALTPDGTAVPDVVSGNNMVLNNMTAGNLVSGKFGSALTFDAASQTHAVYTRTTENGLPISRSAAYTVSFWVKGNGTGQNDLRAFAEGSTTSNNPLLAIGTGNTTTAADQPKSRVFLRDLGATTRIDFRSTNNVFNGEWRHVAIVDNNGAFALYIDGQLDSTRTYLKSTAPDETVSIGGIQRAAASHWFTGNVDELALWNRALTPAEIASLVTAPIPQPVPKSAPFFTVQPRVPAGILVDDTVTMSAGVGGSPGITLQWRKNDEPIPDATNPTLTLAKVSAADNGTYTVVATSAHGSATSNPVVLSVGSYPAPNLTNGMVAYWPLDEIQGVKTPDLASGYDMDLVNLTAADVVPGKWGNAFRFDAARQTLLRRIHTAGDLLPIYQHPSFSVALWVRGMPQTDRRVFSEGSTANTQPLFNIGTHSAGANGSVDSYIRTDTGANGNHRYSVNPAFDDVWHHVVYTQREVGGSMIATLYVDGVRDDVVLDPRRPLTVNNTSIGGVQRATASAWFTGEIDDVAVWNRALSPAEAQMLSAARTPIPPSRLQPLAITRFGTDLPSVAKGGSVTLRWDLSRDATQISIDNGVGDVTTQSIAGVGSKSVSPTVTTTYTITIKRGLDILTAQATVPVVDGVAQGWTLLDNFDRYAPGFLAGTGWWLDLRGRFARVEESGGNRLLSIASTESAAVLDLRSLRVAEGQERTLFFRVMTRGTPTAALQHVVGLTDKNVRWYADIAANIGPAARVGFEGEQWQLAAVNGVGNVAEYAPEPFVNGRVYNVWIDIRNTPANDPGGPQDIYSVHVQEDGTGARSTPFNAFASDRDPDSADPIIGGVAPNLDKLYIAGNNAADSALFDDFYLSQNGYLATVPRAYGFTTPVSAEPPTVAVRTVNGELEVTWGGGTLEASSSLTGGWNPVQGATTSPYRAATTDTQRFFRARR